MEENPELKIVLKKMKSIIDKNEETSKILEKSKQDLKESKDRCSEDLKNFYLVTIKKLEEAYEETMDLVEQEHDKVRGKLEEREKMIHKCTYALLPQIMKLAGSKVTEVFLNESKDVLAANQEAIEMSNAYQSIFFNFIPNSKLRKPKLGYLQLCNCLPSDFKLTILTPISCISIGKQVNCGIEGEITAESLQHLEFGIRKETNVISSQMCVAEDKLVTFSFCPDAAGVYNIMAHLFGQPIVDSPRSVVVAPCNENDVVASTGESKEVVMCDSSTSSPRGNQLSSQKFVLKEVERIEKMSDVVRGDEVCSSSSGNRTFVKCEDSVDGGGWKVGDRCIAKWEEDQIWYRAQITEIQPDGKYFVIFVDYGYSDSVTKLVSNLADILQTDTCDENVGPRGDINGNKDEIQDKDRFDAKGPQNDDKNVIKQIETEEQKFLTEEIPQNKDKQGTENKFSIGEICVARWEDDGVWYNGKVETVNNDGSYVVEFIDYGNSEVVSAPFIVATGADIPKEVKKDEIDENVNTNKVKMDGENNETSEMRSIFTPSVGDVCVARWDEDMVWYNCKVEAANADGSFTVNFIDYGNSEMVRPPYIVKSAKDIPEGVPKENIDENINFQGTASVVGGNETVQSVAPHVSENSIVESKTGEVANDGLKTADRIKTAEIIGGGLKTTSESKTGEKTIGGLKTAGGSKTEEAIDPPKTTNESTAGEATLLFSVGDVCVAKWSEDEVWYNGVITGVESKGYVVMFSDYGNSASVQPTNVVRIANDIPKDVMDDQIDEHVKMTKADGPGHEDPAPKMDLAGSPPVDKAVEKPSALFNVGESCVAKWEEDQVWYNGKITEVNQDGSFVVNFVDYGNSETIFASSIIKDGSKLPTSIPKGQIDENVDTNASNVETNTPENKPKSSDKASTTEVKNSIFSLGDTCVARWNEDLIWYNGKITEVNTDGYFMVNFVDYGNTEVVMPPFIVQNASDIPKSVSKDEIDENVIETRNNVPYEDAIEVEEKQNKIDVEEKIDKKSKTRETVSNEKPDLTTKLREKSTPAVPRPLKQVQSAVPKAPSWQPGDVCLAQWSEDSVWYRGVVEERNVSGTYTITFSDYGNKEEVLPSCVVRDYRELRATGEEWILDVNVQVDDDREDRDAPTNASVENQVVKQNWSVGDDCIAMWSEDEIWYNSRIDQILEDGSFQVTFVDYGNSDVVRQPFIVKDISQISQLDPILDENVVTGKEIVQIEKAINPYTIAVEKTPSPTRQVKPTGIIPYANAVEKAPSPPTAVSPSSRKANSPDAEMIKSLLTPEQLRIMNGTSVITSLDILKSLSDSSKGTRQLPVKKMLVISQDVKEPIGITVLQNRNIVIASTGDDSVKIFSPNGKVISTVQSGRPFKRPSDMFTMSTGDFVVRDDLGLHMFTDKGEFLRDLGKDNIDRCYGVTEDEKGRIVTLNSAKAFPNSKPGTKGRGGQTDVGETDIFFIDQKTGSVVKRIELVDIVQDKAKSKCRFLNYYKGVVFVVDLGLDCIYTINVNGNHAEMFGKSGKGPGQFLDPAGLVVDDFGNMIVADSRNHRLQIFNSKYEHVGIVKVDESPPLKRPSGIYLDKKYRELYVLNYWGNSMVKYRIG